MILKFLSTIEYYQRYKDIPDQFMYDELYMLACIRNMNGLIVSDRGGMDARYVTYKIASDKLKITFDTIWANVKESHKRKYWYYEVNRQMVETQNGEM